MAESSTKMTLVSIDYNEPSAKALALSLAGAVSGTGIGGIEPRLVSEDTKFGADHVVVTFFMATMTKAAVAAGVRLIADALIERVFGPSRAAHVQIVVEPKEGRAHRFPFAVEDFTREFAKSWVEQVLKFVDKA